jgi:hypothetical protein
MLVTHVLAQIAFAADHIEAAGLLQTIRRAVLGFLLFVFLLGGLVGFFIGRAFGRRR